MPATKTPAKSPAPARTPADLKRQFEAAVEKAFNRPHAVVFAYRTGEVEVYIKDATDAQLNELVRLCAKVKIGVHMSDDCQTMIGTAR